MSKDPPQRRAVLDVVAGLVPAPGSEDCVLVAIDGVDGAGKSTFADELATPVRAGGRSVVRVSVDDFHAPRAARYRRGRGSPEGYWLDAFDYAALRTNVLDPLGPAGSRRYRPAVHDLRTDLALDRPWRTAAPGSVVLLDGLFLHRDELRDRWDLSVFLDVPFEVTAARMAQRDGSDPDPAYPGMHRYVQAQRLYFQACSPWRRADVVIDNAELTSPRIVSGRRARRPRAV